MTAARHSREIRVPRETFYEFVDKSIDRLAETSKNERGWDVGFLPVCDCSFITTRCNIE